MAQSLDAKFEEAQTLIRNASTHAEIKKKIANLGYNLKNLQAGQELLDASLLLQEEVKGEYHKKGENSRSLEADLKAVRAIFKDHFTLAGMVFRQDENRQARLGLQQKRASRTVNWLAQTRAFYKELLSNPQPTMRYNVTQAELEQALAMIDTITERRSQRLEKKGNAENATQKRNAALKPLRTWVRDFKAIARVALKDDAQLLEALGIPVASSLP